jgi:Protein of unknown function (DUF3617)
LGLLFFCATSFGATERMAAGQWEFVMTTDGSARTINQCITAEKANEANGDSKSGREYAEKNAKGRCAIESYEIAGDKVTYGLTCGTAHIESITTFHGNTSEGSKVTTTDGKSVRTEIKGRRLGACP